MGFENLMSSCHILHIFLNFGVFGICVFVKGNICTSLHTVCVVTSCSTERGRERGSGKDGGI